MTCMERSVAAILVDLVAAIRPPALRTMRRFAEEELVLPTGPFAGSRFRVSRNPHLGLLLDEWDSKRWRRSLVTGPQQSGKTTVSFGLPTMYSLFELRETTVAGIPDGNMVQDKWSTDIEPLIRRSRYAHLLPDRGPGSKGGRLEAGDAVQFKHGPQLKFMTAGGGDKSRAGYTARCINVTEAEGFDEVGESSREGTKMAQLEGRAEAFGEQGRITLECTVGTEDGLTWREYQQGTQSRICMRCPHCGEYVTPERQHLVGWQDAATEVEAAELARVACPGCAVLWTEEDRVSAAMAAVLAHRGQWVTREGQVQGPVPATYTLSFRWNAINNILKPISETARKEWQAKREPDEDAAEKKMCQFHWAIPPKGEKERDGLAVVDIVSRTTPLPRGEVPGDAAALVVSVDVGKWVLHWAATAFTRSSDGRVSPHVVDYGRADVPTADLGETAAITAALRQLRDGVAADLFAKAPKAAAAGVVDGGYQQDVALAFAAESRNWRCAKGQGVGQYGLGGSRGRGAERIGFGEGWEAWQLPGRKAPIYEHQSDHWKGFVHAALTTPVGAAGGMTLFAAASPGEHLTLARHVLAEKAVEEFVAGKGLVRRWVAMSRQNHFLDALALSCLGASLLKVIMPASAILRPAAPVAATTKATERQWGARTPDGRPFLITQR